MKKLVVLLLVIILTLSSVSILTACRNGDVEELVVYNWADYIYDQEGMEEDFKAYYKAKTGKDINVTYVTFDTNETMLTNVTKSDAQIDVMCPSDYAIQKLVEGDYLIKLNYFTDESYENADKVNHDILNKVKESFADKPYDLTEYFVPYMWGTLGVLYNADVITEEQAMDAGWGLLWNQDSKGNKLSDAIEGKIYMKDSIRDAYCAVLLYLKQYGKLPAQYDSMSISELINTVDDTLLAISKEALIKQRPSLYGYEVDFGKNELIAGTALVDLAWSGDAMYAIEEAEMEGVNLDYFIPSIGGNVWLDGWVVPKTCQNVEAAKMFIDFLNIPEIAMKNMMEIGYSAAVDADALQNDETAMETYFEVYEIDTTDADATQEAIEYFFADERRYPDTDVETLGVMQDFGVNNDKVVTMWESVKVQDSNGSGLLIIIVVAVVVVGGVIFAVTKLGSKKRRVVKK